MKIHLLFYLVFWSFGALANDYYPINEYELVVIESLPENLDLSMSLSQINEAKERSRLQVYKDKLYQILTNNLAPLLTGKEFVDGYNLYELVTQIPLQKIADEMFMGHDPLSASEEASDFMVLILPRLSPQEISQTYKSTLGLYSARKASVYSYPVWSYSDSLGLDELLSERIHEAIDSAYQRQYLTLNKKNAFFVGALLHFKGIGQGHSIRLQLLGGLPTDIQIPFEQVEKEAHFREIRSPKTPGFKLLSNDYPGVIFDLNYSYGNEPTLLKLTFGSLAAFAEKQWKLYDGPESFDDLLLGTDSLGVTSLMKRFNVPHLYGEILDVSGWGLIDSTLATTYDIQMNIHEVTIDIEKLEIVGIRVTAELPVKEHLWLLEPGLRLPTFELPAINEKFKQAGNEALAPYRDEIQGVLNDGPLELLNNPKVQKLIIETLLGLYENNGGVLK